MNTITFTLEVTLAENIMARDVDNIAATLERALPRVFDTELDSHELVDVVLEVERIS
jgi:hypothetical protein